MPARSVPPPGELLDTIEAGGRMIDTHAHLGHTDFSRDRREVIARSFEEGCEAIVEVGWDAASSKAAAGLAAEHPRIYASVGIHPHEADGATVDSFETIAELLKKPKVVAIGETGLDFYRNYSSPVRQREIFRWQIALARSNSLPLIIHDRDAHADVLSTLRRERGAEVGGVMHCFSGDVETARQAVEMGFHIGLGGSLTYGRKEDIWRDILRVVPLERMLLETDCPWLSPAPYRGKRNEPMRVGIVLDKLSQLLGADRAELERVTSENARRLFRLS
jgi:TatD DNase family protein